MMYNNFQRCRRGGQAAQATLGLAGLVALLAHLVHLAPLARASDGLGTRALWHAGSLLDSEFAGMDASEADKLFKRPVGTGANDESALYERFVNLIKGWPVELVAPGRDLTKLMNVLSTKSRAHFLEQQDEFYKHLGVGTTSRPMLMAYLGLRLSSRDHLDSWLGPALLRAGGPVKQRVVQACNSLLTTRNEHALREPSRGDLLRQLLHDLKSQLKAKPRYKFHLAYLTFNNNLNLFMLESFLILCGRLTELADLGPQAHEFSQQYEPLF